MRLRDREVVQHADVRHLDPGFPGEPAVRVEAHDCHVVGRFATRFVAERDELAGFRIDLRMRGEGPALELATERVVVIERLERIRVNHDRRAVFLQREELAVMEDDAGVRGAAAQAR